jgi:hypothetical protein
VTSNDEVYELYSTGLKSDGIMYECSYYKGAQGIPLREDSKTESDYERKWNR